MKVIVKKKVKLYVCDEGNYKNEERTSKKYFLKPNYFHNN